MNKRTWAALDTTAIAQGDANTAAGDGAKAKEAYDLVDVITKLQAVEATGSTEGLDPSWTRPS